MRMNDRWILLGLTDGVRGGGGGGVDQHRGWGGVLPSAGEVCALRRHTGTSHVTSRRFLQAWAGFRLRGGGGGGCRYSPLAGPLPQPPQKDQLTPPPPPPQILWRLTPGPGGDPDLKVTKKRKWGFWNQRVEGVQINYHLRIS